MKKSLSFFLVFIICVVLTFSTGAYATGLILSADTPNGAPPATIPAPSSPDTNFSVNANGKIVISGSNGSPSSNQDKNDSGIVLVTPKEVPQTPVITKNPSGETVEDGGNAVFLARADYATNYIWYVLDAAGSMRYPAANIGQYFDGVVSTGANTERLVLYGLKNEMDGFMVQCEFSNAYGSEMSSPARFSVLAPTPTPTPVPTATPTPMPTSTPMPTPTPTQSPKNVTVNGGGSGTQGTSNTNGAGVMSNKPSTVSSNASAPEEPAGVGYSSLTGTTGSGINDVAVTNAASVNGTERASGTSAGTGAYILAAAAGAVIIGAIAIMALYMKGKISLGKFENIMNGSETTESDMFEGNEFYNPDDFKPDDKNHSI